MPDARQCSDQRFPPSRALQASMNRQVRRRPNTAISDVLTRASAGSFEQRPIRTLGESHHCVVEIPTAQNSRAWPEPIRTSAPSPKLNVRQPPGRSRQETVLDADSLPAPNSLYESRPNKARHRRIIQHANQTELHPTAVGGGCRSGDRHRTNCRSRCGFDSTDSDRHGTGRPFHSVDLHPLGRFGNPMPDARQRSDQRCPPSRALTLPGTTRVKGSGGVAVSYAELTTVLTRMKPVGLADPSTYTTTELVSRLLVPSACAYGSEG